LSQSSSTVSPSTPVSTETSITTSLIPPRQRFRGDGDADNPGDGDGNGDIDPGHDKDNDYPTPNSYKFPDEDDQAVFDYGRRPSAAEGRTITGIVRRYYSDGAAGRGAAACSLLNPRFAAAAAESYGGAGGLAYLRGAKSCASVLDMLFRHFAAELTEAPTILAVRVEGGQAQVVLASRKMRSSHVILMREGSLWRIGQLIGQPLP